MEIISTGFEGLYLIQPKIFYDDRGYFFESYHKEKLAAAGIISEFVQDNQSLSDKNVLRGLHFQNPPFAQGKLVRIITGSVLDLVVDIRKESKTYGKHYKVELNEENKTMLWIPQGFAHGFLTLRDNTIFAYKCTNYYNKNSEGCILWNDADLNIDWEVENPIISAKDLVGSKFREFETLF